MIQDLFQNNPVVLVVVVVVVVGSGGAGNARIWLKQDWPGVNGCRSLVKGTQESIVLVSTSVLTVISNLKKKKSLKKSIW